MQHIIELLASINFWTIVGSASALLAVIIALFVWRYQFIRERTLPSRSDVYAIEGLVSKLLVNAEALHLVGGKAANKHEHAIQTINSAAWEIRQQLNTLCNREQSNKTITSAAEAFYRELSSSINSKIIRTDDIRRALEHLRRSVG